MKWKLNALAAAIALAVSAPASAAITNSLSGNGELFFSVWDEVSQTSYTRDLGIDMNTFATASAGTVASLPTAAVTTAGYSLVFGADSTLTSWLSSVSSNLAGLVWNVGAMDGTGQDRYLTTAGSQSGLTNSALSQLKSADQYIDATNVLGTHPAIAHGSNTASVLENGATAWAGGPQWGNTWGGKAVGFTSGALIGASNFFWILSENGTAALSAAHIRQFGNADGFSTWTFGTDGTLAFNSAAPAAIPVPAAVWLLGSGLLGLAGIARRRQMKLV